MDKTTLAEMIANFAGVIVLILLLFWLPMTVLLGL